MPIRVQVEGLTRLNHKSRHMTNDVRRAVRDQIHDEIQRMESGARTLSRAYNKMTRIAGETIDAATDSSGGAIMAGGGAGLPRKLFYGGEFGGRMRRKTHIGRRGGNYYIIRRRRTTRMFLPHLGRRGYFYFPTIRTVQVGQKERVWAAAGKAVRK